MKQLILEDAANDLKQFCSSSSPSEKVSGESCGENGFCLKNGDALLFPPSPIVVVEDADHPFNPYNFLSAVKSLTPSGSDDNKCFVESNLSRKEYGFFVLNCDEDELPQFVASLFRRSLQAHLPPLTLYHVIVNTLTYYFSRKTWSYAVQENVVNVISQVLSKDDVLLQQQSSESGGNGSGGEIDNTLQLTRQELETKVFMEAFILKYSSVVDISMLAKKLELFRSTFGEKELNAFYGGIFCSEFFPSLYFQIYELSLNLGIKLKKSYSKINGQNNSPFVTPTKRKSQQFNEEIPLKFFKDSKSDFSPRAATNSEDSTLPQRSNLPIGIKPEGYTLITRNNILPKEQKSSLHSIKDTSEYSLDRKFVEKYKQRMNCVKNYRNKDTGIFYGRERALERVGLFDEQQLLQSTETGLKREKKGNGQKSVLDQQQQQKNRARRVVKSQGESLYIAHSLLNTHNDDPFRPFKVCKKNEFNSAFKIKKLVRPAIKSKRKKMDKLRRRSENDRKNKESGGGKNP